MKIFTNFLNKIVYIPGYLDIIDLSNEDNPGVRMRHVKLVNDFSQGKTFYLNGKEYACVDVTSPTNGMFDFVLRSDDESLFIDKVWIHKYGSGDFYYRIVVSGQYVGKINQHQINEIIR